MVLTAWIGALLIICGVLMMARTAIFRGRLSDPHSSRSTDHTLEPSTSGIRAFGLARNWPGLVLIAIGLIVLLIGASIFPPM
jgi:hypothetical protein